MTSRRRARWVLLLVWVASMAPLLHAHPRPYRHRHREPQRAVIVVGNASRAPRAAVVTGAPRGVLDMNVKPRSTEVWVDGYFRGSCDEFDGFPGKLHLPVGMHDLKLVLPDGVVVERQVRVRAGVEVNVGIDLR